MEEAFLCLEIDNSLGDLGLDSLKKETSSW